MNHYSQYTPCDAEDRRDADEYDDEDYQR